MTSNKTSTFILLERGVEDVNLKNEIRAIERRLIDAGVNPYTMFPTVISLRQNIESELNES